MASYREAIQRSGDSVRNFLARDQLTISCIMKSTMVQDDVSGVMMDVPVIAIILPGMSD
jgi:hypothetical protein